MIFCSQLAAIALNKLGSRKDHTKCSPLIICNGLLLVLPLMSIDPMVCIHLLRANLLNTGSLADSEADSTKEARS